jgi:hypothetical protein
MNMLAIRAGVEPAIGCGYRLKLTGYRSLEVPGPGAVAHMSLHQKPTMSKSRQTVIADSAWFPDLHRGTGYPNLLATERCGGGGSRQRRVGEGHIWVASDSVNGFLQFYFTSPQEPQNSAIFSLFLATRTPQFGALEDYSRLESAALTA